MTDSTVRRVTRSLTPQEQERLRQQREQLATELPDLIDRDSMRREALAQRTLSGEFRRAIHESRLSLVEIAERGGISPLTLDEFLTGERNLRSDVLDRLAEILGLALQTRDS